ncbi:sigma-70 family RNA polymerase sigma factor [Streptomyces canus]|uniref:sigma-70 family RNA polymerase sigma factor n=1 Tax=Streptomyces canus TaxID=58343 RepID=UPI00368E479D
MNGFVPESVFAQNMQTLGLAQVERDRLRRELARLGLHVQDVRVHVDADSPDVEKVARIRGENLFPGADLVQGLLLRYADTDGYVTSRAVDGVARLAGLGARQTAALRAWAKVRDSDGDAATVDSCTEETRSGGEGGEPSASEKPGTGAEGRDIAAAVVAALAVLEEDRFRRRPGDCLLKAEVEVGLAVLLRGGADLMGQEPDAEELSRLPSGDLRIRARNCLVLHNQRLVHSLIRPYLEQGLDYEDLFQVGALGLMRAARKFDPAKGYKFSTYATWWVRQQITRAIADEGALIRIPVHMHEQMRKVAAAERALAARGRSASVVDVAVQCDMTVQKVEEIRKLSRRTDSLDRVIGDGATLGDFVGASHALPSVEQGVVNTLLLEDAMAVVDTFSERDARVLVRRLGLDGDEPSTLDELGREFGVTRERIRQVESKALSAFRARLRMAGVISAYEGGNAQEALEYWKLARSMQQRAHGKAKAVVSVDEPSSPADSAPPQADEPSYRNEGEEAPAVEESERDTGKDMHDGVMDPSAPTSVTQAAEQEEPDGAGEHDEVDEPELPEEGSPAEPVQRTADWEKALRLGARFEGGIDWLAEYALLALGQAQLTVILGPQATADVVLAARERRMPDRQVLTALEVLQRVFDTLRKGRLRPEDFFERPSEALVGLTPRGYLARKPLVNSESRLAVRDALRELAAGIPSRLAPEEPPPASGARLGGASAGASSREATKPEGMSDDARSPTPGPADGQGRIETIPCRGASPDESDESPHHVPGHDEAVDGAGGAPAAEAELSSEDRDERPQSVAVQEEKQGSTDDGQFVAGLRREHEAELERVRLGHEERLAHELRARQAVEARAAAEVDTERQLDGLEDVLLRRMDKTLARREQFLRAEAGTQIELLKQEQHVVRQGLVRQVEQAEETARAAAEDADFHRKRAGEADRRLREYREGAETRISELEARLRQAEVALAQRDRAVEAARRHAENVEQQAAQRIAQSEHNAWARITELQQELAAAQSADADRTTFRDRWRRA